MGEARSGRLVGRYGPGARVYDVLSMEAAVYRIGRCEVISHLGLRHGDRVLDVGCGTGLSLPLLADAVGRGGEVVGLDASAAMLDQADRRAQSSRWGSRVRLIHGPAETLPDVLSPGFDAVLFAYSLGVIEEWQSAWEQALSLLVPGGRVGVVDTTWPSGRWRVMAPLAGLAFLTGGVHPSRRVWQHVAEETTPVWSSAFRGDHVRAAVGTYRPDTS